MGDEEDTVAGAGLRFSIQNETFRLILGVLTMVTGLLKLLSAVPGDVPVAGDLLPALVGLAAGFILVFEFYRGRSGMESERLEQLEGIVTKNRRWIGFGAVGAAALHFLFPSVLLL
ncbi:MAG: hypothetical protein LBP32_09160 [Spirochaetaceae bacterium]|jgi:hypothetical protein|nr:hypothetical protein [Spirochaetaceae bacterium]